MLFLYEITLLMILLSVDGLPQQVIPIKDSNRTDQYNLTSNGLRYFQNDTHPNKLPLDFERGVCYVEVPTAGLVHDPAHIPAGNGSRSDLSRIRTCCQGYTRNPYNFKICDPVCENCVNGLCTAPGVCTCYPDHVRNLGGFCIPVCPIFCQNGRCEDSKCVCNPKHRLDVSGKFCVPLCEINCGGQANCTSPNICECKVGYQVLDGNCVPRCSKCVNGDCVGPNNCVCYPGYNKNDQGECVPQCALSCPSGRCISPNACGCEPGLQMSADGSCKSSCDSCENGQCDQSNVCICHTGFVKDNHGLCIPDCPKGCKNGQCISPGVCACPHGLEMDSATGQCVAKCNKPCVNGICVGPNTCACKTGYVPDKTDPENNRCMPSCSDGCQNGVCTAPNFCLCNLGYYKDNSVKGQPSCQKRSKRSALPSLIYDLDDYDF